MSSETLLPENTPLPGSQLRRAREALGMTLDDAAVTTRIVRSYLEALEGGRYERLPNPAYVKGIIRSYAEVLGIPSDPLIAGYDQVREPDDAAEEPARRSLPRPGGRVWVALGLISVIICLGYLLAGRESSTEQLPQPVGQVEPAPPLSRPLFPARTTHSRPAPPTPAVSPAPDSREKVVEKPVVAGAGVILKARVVADSDLTITVDDTPSQQYDLKTGDVIEWKGERLFILEVSNGGALEMELNGKPLPSLGKSDEPASVVITADGKIH